MSDQWAAFFAAMQAEMDSFYRQHGPGAHQDTRHAEISRLVRGPRVLDVGCGAGDLLLMLSAAHPEWDLHGTDISGVALTIARDRGLRARLMQQATLPREEFDTVVLSQVLEHMEAGAGHWLMAQAARCADRILVSVPNGGAVKSPYHLIEFTEDGLLMMLSQYGTARLHEWPGSKKRLIAVVTRR